MTENDTPQSIYAKPLWIRAWHWSNALLIVMLALTGVSLHFTDPKVALLEFSLASNLHTVAGAALVLLYVVFIAASIASGNWRRFLPEPSTLVARCLAQARYYAWGTFRGEPSPSAGGPNDFNALQAIVYCAILFVAMPIVVVSGLVFLFPEIAPDRAFGMSGLLPVAVAHYVTATLIVAFMIGHIYLGTMGKSVTSAFRTMITGWHHH